MPETASTNDEQHQPESRVCAQPRGTQHTVEKPGLRGVHREADLAQFPCRQTGSSSRASIGRRERREVGGRDDVIIPAGRAAGAAEGEVCGVHRGVLRLWRVRAHNPERARDIELGGVPDGPRPAQASWCW